MPLPPPGRLAAAAQRLRRDGPAALARRFALPAPARPGRRRLFSVAVTFWLFLAQTLGADRSCREAVRRALAWLFVPQGRAASPSTAAYCQARQRLPAEWLATVQRQVVDALEARPGPAELWRGRRVKLVDGSCASMPDTPDNQRAFPQPRGQRAGCGFPLIRFVVVFSLTTGALLDWAWGCLRTHERTLFHRLWDGLEKGDVVLADRGFCSLADYWLLARRGVDCVMRKHQRRGVGSRQVRRWGRGDRLMHWLKSKAVPDWLDPAAWAEIPPALLVREVDVAVEIPGFRTRTLTVATTLLDPGRFPAAAFAELYRRRWLAELCLRDVKTTLGLDVLRCRTPAMVLKELWMFWIGYNLLRTLLFQAARAGGCSPWRLSFKGSLAALRQWAPLLWFGNPALVAEAWRALLSCIARDPLPLRPNRVEPRAVKRRPKNYARLTQPRHVYQEIPHRSRYRKRLS